MMGDYLSVIESAKILNCTRQEIVRKIWRGFIKTEKVGRSYIIHKDEVVRLKREQKKK